MPLVHPLYDEFYQIMTGKVRHYIFILLFLPVLAGLPELKAQTQTSASGIVKDSITGEVLSFVSVLFLNSTTGVMTDDQGTFSLRNSQGNTQLVFSSLGYHTKTVVLKAGERNDGLEILLAPTSFQIQEVYVKPTRQKYSRRNNPAVELIKKVIEHKTDNRIEAKDEYQAETYDKLSFAFDDFNPDPKKNKLLNKLQFIKNYIDTSEFNGKPILIVSVRETLADVYYRKSPRTQKTFIKARRHSGIDNTLDEGGITSNLEEIFRGVDIFDNNINILLNRFVSPLSSLLATTYYQYYIMDTLDVAGDRCVDLAFVPVNSQSYGFTGRLYVTLDGHYSVKKVVLNVPYDINLNFVSKLRIEQEFERAPDSTWMLHTEKTYINFGITKKGQQLYASHFRSYNNYRFSIENPDSIFQQLGNVHQLAEATSRPDSFWVSHRHIPIKEKEDALNDLLKELRKVPAFNVMIGTAEILISSYIKSGKRNVSKFDFGPMNTTISGNKIEGFRFRVGGMTTANLNPHLFANGYAAYGLNDRKWKYNATLTYAFNKKAYHTKEPPANNLSFIQEYDLYSLGENFLYTSKDNLFVAWKVGEPLTKMSYIRKTMLQYEKEWANGLSVKTWMQNQTDEPTGTLRYTYQDPEGELIRKNDLTTSELGMQFRFAPGERAYSSRRGKDSPFNLSKDAPVFKLSHQMGLDNVLGGEVNYHHTELSAEKRIWLSSFGHIDAQLKAGKVWNEVPFPLLIIPNTNQSVTIQPEAFHMMRALEFVTDQYVSFNATYYLKGWILNRIPGIRVLRLREVVSFNGIYGDLSRKNNPAYNSNLFIFPEETGTLGNTPYMEASIGLENILKILRIDYYRRLTYLDHPNIKKSGIRIALRFTF